MPTASLTSREEQVRALVVDGFGTDGVAEHLGISRRTVETHLRNVYKKLGVHRRDELADTDTDTDSGMLVGSPACEGELRRLEAKLAARDRQVESFEAAVERIIDRQFPLFEERVELTVSIGTQSSEDMVVERHWTTPKPYLVYRVIRPVAAWGVPYDKVVDGMSVTCEVASADVGVAVEVFSDRHGRPVAIILFQPGLEAPTEWVLRYRTPGLWDPLRANGRDTLRWAPGRLDGRSSSSINDLTIHFDFPPGGPDPRVSAKENVGRVELSEPDDVGSARRISYRDRSRAGAQYDFGLSL